MSDSQHLPRIGIQLYSVRDLTDPADFRTTLSRIADLGFEGVEFAWKYGGLEPSELADFLSSHGLCCCGMHAQLDELLQPEHAIYTLAAAVGSPFMTTSLAGRESEWRELLPKLNQAGHIVAGHGLRFTYHNHAQEFNAPPGASAFDDLVTATAAEPVGLELDLGWIHKAGHDALDLWRRLTDRTPQIHLRDYDRDAQQGCDVGDGFMDVAGIWHQARELGTEWVIYEQDRYPVGPMESAAVCMRRLAAVRSAAE